MFYTFLPHYYKYNQDFVIDMKDVLQYWFIKNGCFSVIDGFYFNCLKKHVKNKFCNGEYLSELMDVILIDCLYPDDSSVITNYDHDNSYMNDYYFYGFYFDGGNTL